MFFAKDEYRIEFARRYFVQGLKEGEAKGHAEGRLEGRAEGLAEGRRKGRAEGRSEGRTELVRRQLIVRFGALSESARGRLQTASSKELDRIGERLLTASTLSEALDSQ